MDAAKNFAKGTLSTGYDDTATSIVLVSGAGFPAAPFNAVWWNSTDFPDPADDTLVEIVRVTAKSTDTFTISRGQEGTGNPGVAGNSHDLEGKVYKLIAPLTAKTMDDILPSTRSGDDYTVTAPGALQVNAATSLAMVAQNGTARFESSTAGMALNIGGTVAGLGDVDENNSGAALLVDDNVGVVGHRGKLGTDQSATATTSVGSLAKKIPIYNNAGTLLGYIPVYDAIT